MNEEINKSSKAAFGDMIIHSDNLNLFINRLQTIRDNLIDNTIDEIVIDEWHINTEQSKLRKHLSASLTDINHDGR